MYWLNVLIQFIYMMDPSSKILLYHPKLSYQEKYKIATLTDLLSYLPPENDCYFLDLPEEIIHIICNGVNESIWSLMQCSQYLMKVVRQYQSIVPELKFCINRFKIIVIIIIQVCIKFLQILNICNFFHLHLYVKKRNMLIYS